MGRVAGSRYGGGLAAPNIASSFPNFSTRYIPPKYPWSTGPGIFWPGESTPRTNLEAQGKMVRTWPTIYRIPARGLGNMPLFQLGPTEPVFVNNFATWSHAYAMQMPGLSKLSFGG